MTKRYLITLAAVAALSACGGSGGTGDNDSEADIGILSSGILTDVEVPSPADLAGLPTEVEDFVNAFVEANESFTQTATRPFGTADYAGQYGFGFDAEDNPTVVYGDMTMGVDFGTGNISGSITNLTGDSEGQVLTIGNDLTVLAVIDNQSDIAGTVAGDVVLDGQTYDVEASIAGAFGGDAAETAVGTTMGLVTNPDATTDSFSGYFLVDKH